MKFISQSVSQSANQSISHIVCFFLFGLFNSCTSTEFYNVAY